LQLLYAWTLQRKLQMAFNAPPARGFIIMSCNLHRSVIQRTLRARGGAELIADAGTAGLLTRFPSMSMGDRSWQITSVAEF
jgi:hypothetical protein